VDVVQGDLNALRSTGLFNGTVNDCISNDVTGTSVSDSNPDPTAGNGYYYLLSPAEGKCNAPALWATGEASEATGRDDAINGVSQDPSSCP